MARAERARLARGGAQFAPALARPELLVQRNVQLAIERGREWPLIEHVEVVGILPVLLKAELRLDIAMEFRPRQRVGDRHPDIVGAAVAHQLQRPLYIGARLARIAELQEETDLDPGFLHPRRRRDDLL